MLQTGTNLNKSVSERFPFHFGTSLTQHNQVVEEEAATLMTKSTLLKKLKQGPNSTKNKV